MHRKVILDCLKETPYSILAFIPVNYEVHHMDYNKEHNCPSNLLILDLAFHSCITAHGRKRIKGKFSPKWKKPPDWLPLFDFVEDEIPF